jgi:hypothetical protein
MSNGPAPPSPKHALLWIAESVFFGAGLIATWLALAEYYGGAATSLFFGVGTLIAVIHFALRDQPGSLTHITSRILNDRFLLVATAIGGLLIVAALVAWWCGWMRVTYGRASFTHNHYALKIAKFNPAQNEFGLQSGSTQPGELSKQDKSSKQKWVQWMIEPFTEPTIDFNGKKVFTSLVYIESVPFEDNYDSFHAWIEVDAAVTKMGHPLAFLVDEGDNGIWYKPMFRQLDVSMVGENDAMPYIHVEKPNRAERLVLFLPVGNKRNPEDLPDLRQCFPNQHHLEVK